MKARRQIWISTWSTTSRTCQKCKGSKMLTTMWTECTRVQSSTSSKMKDKMEALLFRTLKTKQMKPKLRSSHTTSKKIGVQKRVNSEPPSTSPSSKNKTRIFSAAREVNTDGQLSGRAELACNRNRNPNIQWSPEAQRILNQKKDIRSTQKIFMSRNEKCIMRKT